MTTRTLVSGMMFAAIVLGQPIVRQEGIPVTDPVVLDRIRNVPRHIFVDEALGLQHGLHARWVRDAAVFDHNDAIEG